MINISYAILAYNETDSLKELLNFLNEHKKEKDEIVVVADTTATPETMQILNESDFIKLFQHPLNKDFAQQKNYLTDMCKNEYIVNVDADEMLTEIFMRDIHQVIEINDADLIYVPRINTVDGITDEHIQKWRWRLAEKGWINFPDYQSRCFKKAEHIRWVGKVHERIHGIKTYSFLPPTEDFAIIHHKTIDRQEQQNEFYGGI